VEKTKKTNQQHISKKKEKKRHFNRTGTTGKIVYLTHADPDFRKPHSLCESVMTPRNDVVPDISLPAASNALRISDDTVRELARFCGDVRGKYLYSIQEKATK